MVLDGHRTLVSGQTPGTSFLTTLTVFRPLMSVLIGTDEAGYGPNLGPLVVTATTWHLPYGMQPSDLPDCLSEVVTDRSRRGDNRLHVADSKQVYSSGKSIASLERGVLAFLKTLGIPCDSLGVVGEQLGGPQFATDYAEVCKDVVPELSLPVAIDVTDCERSASQLATVLNRAGVRLLSIESCIMFPPEFNAGVVATDSKGKVLSAATLSLVKSATQHPSADADGWVVCDKHGGRNRYDDIISAAFDDAFVFRLEESGPCSRYRLNNLEFCFRTKAEEVLPVALASMVCKYVRETVMMQFNAFWKHHLPDLKPTKGYPQDAKRFWADISEKAEQLDINKSDIWRVR